MLNELQTLYAEADGMNEMLKVMSKFLKKESMRLMFLISKYEHQSKNHGILDHPTIPKEKYPEAHQYNELISKQFAEKLQMVMMDYSKIRNDITKLKSHVEAKPSQDYNDQLAKIKESLQNTETKLVVIWKEEYFLTMNYRMDISAKELERWSKVLQIERKSADEVQSEIDDLFKA